MRLQLLFYILAFSINSSTYAADFIPADISFPGIFNQYGISSNTFLNNEPITLRFTLTIDEEDFGTERAFYLVAEYRGQLYMKNEEGEWLSWDGRRETLVANKHAKPYPAFLLPVLDNQTLPAGEYIVYAGYLSKQGAIKYSAYPATLLVFESSQSDLQRIQNRQTFNEFLRMSLMKLVVRITTTTDPGPFPDSPVPKTDLHENGVDDADRIKTHGETVFAAEQCLDSGNSCVGVYHINASPAGSEKWSSIDSGTVLTKPLIYIHQDKDSDKDSLIWLGESHFYPEYPENYHTPDIPVNTTEIRFLDVDEISAMQVSIKLELEGKRVFSRLINNKLYVVIQHDLSHLVPVFYDPTDSIHSPEFVREPFMPKIHINDQQTELMYRSSDCYITPQNSELPVYHALIGIIEIPLDNPAQFKSDCLVGSVEAIHATNETMYLASTRYSYQIFDGFMKYTQPGNETDIHKFAFAESGLKYLASGSINGHLGWQADKKSFRMGEHQGILKVATSQGETREKRGLVQVAVLQENSKTREMETIGLLENIGNPGDKLYTARFIGNRGFLDNFTVAKPLIVLDFTTPTEPKMLGELKLDAFADYLQPIGKNHLLMIGKEAVSDETPERGAWEQGIKLSLFDLSDSTNMREINNLNLGKRGSTSAVFNSPHALAWQNSDGEKTSVFAIPVDLHDTPPDNANENPPNPWTPYKWTHTGLYTFSVNTTSSPGIDMNGAFIAEALTNGDIPLFTIMNDRAVIQGETAHYIHNNQVFSSELKDLQ